MVEQHPQRPALCFEGHTWSYQVLARRANQLSRVLRDHGVEKGDRVGVMMGRSAHFIEALIAITQIGAVYVPLDPDYPSERLQYMLSDSEAKLVLTHSQWQADDSAGVPVLQLDRLRLETYSDAPVTASIDADDSVYVIYTSGSTGQPKGAILHHRGALNHIDAECHELGFDGGFNFLQSAPSSSDISVWQFIGPVVTGGKTVILDEVTDSAKMFRLLVDEQVHLAELVPVVLQLLLDYVHKLPEDERALPSLRYMMATGETVPVELVNRWLTTYPDIRGGECLRPHRSV